MSHVCQVLALGEILTREQLKGVQTIVNKKCSLEQKATQLKNYLKPFAAELEKKGVVADYLAYVIAYKLSESPVTKGQK